MSTIPMLGNHETIAQLKAMHDLMGPTISLADLMKGDPGAECWHCGRPEMRWVHMSEHGCFQCTSMTYGWRCSGCGACESKGCEHATFISIMGVRFFGEEAAEIKAKARARWSAA